MNNVARAYTQSNLSQDLWAMNLSLKKALSDPNPGVRSEALAEAASNLAKVAGGLAELSATSPTFSIFASATGVLAQVRTASNSIETSISTGQSVKVNDLLSLVGSFSDVVGTALLKPGPTLIPGIALKGVALTASGAQNYLTQFGYENLTVDQMGTMLAASVDQSNRVWGAALQGYSWDELQVASSSISLANGGHPWLQGTSAGDPVSGILLAKQQYAQDEAAASIAATPVTSPPDLGTPARNSADYAVITGNHTAELIPSAGGGVDDIWILKGGQTGTGFTKDEFRAAILVSNPNITNLNNIAGGLPLYLPQKFADGSITYHYANGASINNNVGTGEYFMVVSNTDGSGGQTTYSRTKTGTVDGVPQYDIRQTSTNAQGAEILSFQGNQSGADGDIVPTNVVEHTDTDHNGTLNQTANTTFGGDDAFQISTDTNGDGTWDTSTLTVGNDDYNLYDPWQMGDAEAALYNIGLDGGLYNPDFYDQFTAANTSFLLTSAPSTPQIPYNPGMGPGSDPWGIPIGAFYESVALAADNAPSIADKTPVLLGANNQGLTPAQLAALDTNADGQLSGSELTGLTLWSDLNENGHLDAGELTATASAIQSTDYSFYSAGNGHPGAGVAATPEVNQPAPTVATPASNYRTLRDTDNVYVTPSGGIIQWTANQIKTNFNNKSYLIGTDGNDSFDANYYAAYPQYFNNSLLTHFLGGGGDDQMGGSTRSDNLWGGTGNDILWGYAGDDALYGEEGDDIAQGGDGNDRLAGGIGNDILLGDAGNDLVVGGDGADELQGNDGNDQLSGDAGDDRLFGQVGDDQLWGGEGDDILVGFTASNEAKQSLIAGETDNDTLIGGAGSDLLIGGFGNDILDGGSGKDELAGDDGNDQLMGGADDDKLFGGAGDDKLWGGDGNDVMLGFTASNDAKQTLAAGETDNDALYAGAGNDLVLGGLGNDTLYGETGDDELQGGEGSDQLHGGEGADRLFGQVGDDTLYGGDGDDILVGFTASNEAQQSLNAGETDNDKLYGGAGHDLLIGGVGNDYLDGGAGADDMFGGTGDDTYIVNSVNDAIYENQNSGYDKVASSTNYQLNQNIEELRLLEGYEIHGTGNKLDNKIIGNSANNILDGVTGADIMIGGAGDDTYYVDNAGDQVIENANEGIDTVQSSIDTTLGANLEHLILLDFSKPELGRVTGQDGVARDALVYGFPKRFELDYLQGDEVEGFEGTCALTSVANLLTQSGKPTTEGDVVRRAIDNQWAVTDPNLPSWQRGGSNANEQLQLLTSYGLRADLLAGYNETSIANLVRSGRGVIVAVDAGVIWESTQYETGQVNHAVTLTGAVYAEADGALLGFYVTDSGRAKVSDMTRFIPIDLFREAANVPGAYSLYTIEPVKLWDENIDGTGNDGANQITGNRGDNVLAGMAGDDALAGLKSRRWWDGDCANDLWMMAAA